MQSVSHTNEQTDESTEGQPKIRKKSFRVSFFLGGIEFIDIFGQDFLFLAAGILRRHFTFRCRMLFHLTLNERKIKILDESIRLSCRQMARCSTFDPTQAPLAAPSAHCTFSKHTTVVKVGRWLVRVASLTLSSALAANSAVRKVSNGKCFIDNHRMTQL